MEIQALKIFNSIKLILFLILVLGVITVLTACGDLIKESDTGVCDNAIDARNYETALSVCTSRKDRASAYMGKAGYDIINLLKSSGTTVSQHDVPTNAALGDDDVAGASILNILQLSEAIIAADDARAAAISSSRSNLDNASAELQKYLIESEITDKSPPLDTDEILLNTFAISFAMQLNQLELYDNGSATTKAYPTYDGGGEDVSNLECAAVTNSTSDSDAQAKLKERDGHLWSTERNSMQCYRILEAITELSGSDRFTAFNNFVNWKDAGGTGTLPEPFVTTICEDIGSLKIYLTNLAVNLVELEKKISFSGDNRKAIDDADNSTKILMAAVGCPTS